MRRRPGCAGRSGAVFSGCSSTRTPLQMPRPEMAVPPSPASPLFERVLIVVLENQDYAKAIKQPYLSGLLRRGFLLSDFHGLYHPLPQFTWP